MNHEDRQERQDRSFFFALLAVLTVRKKAQKVTVFNMQARLLEHMATYPTWQYLGAIFGAAMPGLRTIKVEMLLVLHIVQ